MASQAKVHNHLFHSRFQTAKSNLTATINNLDSELADCRQDLTSQRQTVSTLWTSCLGLRKCLKILRQQFHRLLAKKASSSLSLSLCMKGIYHVKTCRLAGKLVMTGVAAVCVPDIIRLCADAFDIEVKHVPSVCSIGCFVLEGGVSAEI